ncbi:MAG: acetoin utilization protein AcuC [Miltoncostaeaceae bacterium]
MGVVAFVDRQGLSGYDLGTDHPLAPVNRELAIDLIRAYGMLDRPDVTVLQPAPGDEDLIGRVHTAAYMAAVRRYSATPQLAAAFEAGMWGLAHGGDTPAFAGMHEAAVAVCGSSVTAARAVWEGRADRVLSVAGGLHHAFANKANGFCIYNDPAVAIRWLLENGAERVAYVDVDVHHGDGTQFIFYDDPRVLTCSVHESGRYLFPGTGAISERGIGAGEGYSVNVPLPAFSGDGPYLRAIDEVIAPAVTTFRPDVLVTQDGVDPHHQDPLAHLQVRMATFPAVWRSLHRLADDAAGGRWIALGGGGYNVDVLPRAWALLFAEMTGTDLPDVVPADWLALAAERTDRTDLTPLLMGDPDPEVAADERARADFEGDEVVHEAIRTLL